MVDNLVVLHTSTVTCAEKDMFQELALDFMNHDDIEFVTVHDSDREVNVRPRLVVYSYRNTQHPKEFKEEKWNI
jgi:hypothetical protein